MKQGMRSAGSAREVLGVLLGAVMLVTASQSDAVMAGQPPDSPAARVDANGAQSPYAGVGSVVVGGAPLSGVVIASQYVLTAAHVVSGQSPSDIQFVLNLGGPTPWTSAVDQVTVYPTFKLPYDDLAVIRLAQPIPDSVPIYPMYSGALTVGLTITLAGYGGSGNGNVGVTIGANAAVKRLGENVVDALQPTLDSSGSVSRFFIYDFDGPTGNGPLGGATLGNSVETLVAVGDSGSPAFVRNGSQWQLFGINTFVGTIDNSPITYKFGTLGGGIVASDPRFASWLQTATAGTLGMKAFSGDGPMPSWAVAALGLMLLGVAAYETRVRRAVSVVRGGR